MFEDACTTQGMSVLDAGQLQRGVVEVEVEAEVEGGGTGRCGEDVEARVVCSSLSALRGCGL